MRRYAILRGSVAFYSFIMTIDTRVVAAPLGSDSKTRSVFARKFDGERTWFAAPASLLIAIVFLIPLAIVGLQSFYRSSFTFDGYERVFTSTLFWRVLWTTLEITAESTILSLLFGYPLALFLARLSPRRRALMLILVLLPFWTSILVKSFAFIVLLGEQGVVKSLLRNLFSLELGIPLVFSRIGVMVGIVHFLIPFTVFPILNNLLNQSPELHRAALVMGAKRRQLFFRVILPLSLPAVAAAAIMSAVLSIGLFVTPALLGGRRDMLVANLIDYYTREALDWNVAAVLAMILLVVSGMLIAILSRVDRSARM